MRKVIIFFILCSTVLGKLASPPTLDLPPSVPDEETERKQYLEEVARNLKRSYLFLRDDIASWDADSTKITNVTDPASDQDAATKKYVDDQVIAAGGSSQEQTQDWVWSAGIGTETLINVTYQDATNDVDFVVLESNINHDSLTGFAANEHYTQANITATGTVASGTWAATDVGLAHGGTGASLADPGADRIMFWDDGGSTVAWLTPNTGIDITGTDLDIDPTELSGNRTWGDGSTDTIVWTWDRATGTDPAITFGNGSFSFGAADIATTGEVAVDSMSMENTGLDDGGGQLSIDVHNRALYSSAVTVLDWNTLNDIKIGATGPVTDINLTFRGSLGNGAIVWDVADTDFQISGGNCIFSNMVYADGFYLTVQPEFATQDINADRTLDADTDTLEQVADVLGTLIEDLKNKGLLTSP